MPRRRRRRGGRTRGQRESASPRSSEDLVRAEPRQPPTTLTLEPDGQTLEGIIGDLQSELGIPQYPQEYRITIKVAEEGTGRAIQETVQDPPEDKNGSPKREKAPAAPRIAGGIAKVLGGGEQGAGSSGGGRRRRRRKRGRGGRARGGGSGGGTPPQ
jgi:hypothetical protein